MDLDQAAQEMSSGQLDRARERLARLAEHWPDRGEVRVPLGQSELACGRPGAAARAWGRIPHDSAWAAEAAGYRAQLALQAGRFADAEEILTAAIDCRGPKTGTVRWPSGRLDRYHDLAAGQGYHLVEVNTVPKALGGFGPTKKADRSN
jgi:predicted Zn-dependent protease